MQNSVLLETTRWQQFVYTKGDDMQANVVRSLVLCNDQGLLCVFRKVVCKLIQVMYTTLDGSLHNVH